MEKKVNLVNIFEKKKSDMQIANGIYFFLILLFIGVRITSYTGVLGDSDWAGYGLNLFIQVGLMFSLPVFMFTLLKKQKLSQTFKQFRFKWISFQGVILSIILGVFVYILNFGVSNIFNYIITFFGYSPSTSSVAVESYPLWLFLVNLLITCVLPGICEETAHRGMLLHSYEKLGMKKAILLSGILFGLMHLNIEQCFYASIIGFFLAFLTLVSGSIVPGMIVHFMNNAVSVYLTYASVNKLWLGDLAEKLGTLFKSNFLVVMFGTFLVMSLSLFMCVWLTNRIIKESRKKQCKEYAENVSKIKERNDFMKDNPSFVPTPVPPMVERTQEFSDGHKIVTLIIPMQDIYFEQTEKASYADKLFLYGSFFLGIIVTISTFVWGIL